MTSATPASSAARRHLREHEQADHGRGRRQQRDHQRVGRALEPRHRDLVGDVRDHRGRDADADAGRERDRVGERGDRRPARQRRDDDQRDRASPPPARRCRRPSLRHAVREHDVGGEQAGVGERERDAERLALEVHAGEQVDAGHGERERRARCAACARRARPARSRAGTRSRRPSPAAAGRSRGRSSSSSAPARRPRRSRSRSRRAACHGRRQSAKTSAAAAIRSHATPSTSTRDEQQHGEGRAEVVEDGADDEVEGGRPSALTGSLGTSAHAEWPIEAISAAVMPSENGAARRDEPSIARRAAGGRAAQPGRARAAASGSRRPRSPSGWRRLERDGVIAGYRAEVAPARARLHARRDPAHAPGAAA